MAPIHDHFTPQGKSRGLRCNHQYLLSTHHQDDTNRTVTDPSHGLKISTIQTRPYLNAENYTKYRLAHLAEGKVHPLWILARTSETTRLHPLGEWTRFATIEKHNPTGSPKASVWAMRPYWMKIKEPTDMIIFSRHSGRSKPTIHRMAWGRPWK